MNDKKYSTVLVGFGKIGVEYANDPVMAKNYPYASHAQVLAKHPSFSWDAVIDLSREALARARTDWKVPYCVLSATQLPSGYYPEVAVLATPPQYRLGVLKQLQGIKAVLVEKPLGVNLVEGKRFLEYCMEHNILVQVNYWRRADEQFIRLKDGYLSELIGQTQAVFGIYGNGLLNNGSHIVDFVRMLYGEIDKIEIMGASRGITGPIDGDVNIGFTLKLANGITAAISPVDFSQYRENGLDIWGTQGRLAILQEGLGIYHYTLSPNRGMSNEYEISSDCHRLLKTTVGHALYNMYTNLAAALNNKAPLFSTGESALQTANIIETVYQRYQKKSKKSC